MYGNYLDEAAKIVAEKREENLKFEHARLTARLVQTKDRKLQSSLQKCLKQNHALNQTTLTLHT